MVLITFFPCLQVYTLIRSLPFPPPLLSLSYVCVCVCQCSSNIFFGPSLHYLTQRWSTTRGSRARDSAEGDVLVPPLHCARNPHPSMC
uniref:Uncharacterized protein n=1 Tax=Leishmania guyanensis TaxID=5670 RepID=A0A1E1ITI8_LEIGU|nr:Hypothetical protein BN36_1111520 [Leishmania guyanensis]